VSLFLLHNIQINMKNKPDQHSEAKSEQKSGSSLTLSSQAESSSILFREGGICPKCGKGKFEYDGLLNLSCNNCGYCGERGVFTC
jgi:uncharacterized protein (DUF983 family)